MNAEDLFGAYLVLSLEVLCERRRGPRRGDGVARHAVARRRDGVDAEARAAEDRSERPRTLRAGMEMTAYPVLVEIQRR